MRIQIVSLVLGRIRQSVIASYALVSHFGHMLIGRSSVDPLLISILDRVLSRHKELLELRLVGLIVRVAAQRRKRLRHLECAALGLYVKRVIVILF